MAKKAGVCFVCLNESHCAANCLIKYGRCEHDGRGRCHTLLCQAKLMPHDTLNFGLFRSISRTTRKPAHSWVADTLVISSSGLVNALAQFDSWLDVALASEQLAQKSNLQSLRLPNQWVRWAGGRSLPPGECVCNTFFWTKSKGLGQRMRVHYPTSQ